MLCLTAQHKEWCYFQQFVSLDVEFAKIEPIQVLKWITYLNSNSKVAKIFFFLWKFLVFIKDP